MVRRSQAPPVGARSNYSSGEPGPELCLFKVDRSSVADPSPFAIPLSFLSPHERALLHRGKSIDESEPDKSHRSRNAAFCRLVSSKYGKSTSPKSTMTKS